MVLYKVAIRRIETTYVFVEAESETEALQRVEDEEWTAECWLRLSDTERNVVDRWTQ